MIRLWCLLSLLFLSVQCKKQEGTTLVYKPFSYEERADGVEHPAETVVERGLVSKDVLQREILDEYARYSSRTEVKHSGDIPVLGFVTPWNNHGYDMAKHFNNKFTHISPCWLQIRRNTAGKIMVAGKQDIDEGWMREVRNHCVSKCPYIVPRITWEADRFSPEDLTDLKRLLADTAQRYQFDGFVFEFGFSSEILPLMMEIRSALEGKQIILVAHPEAATSIREGDSFLSALSACVNYVVVMSYDYSVRRGKVGPNAPMRISFHPISVLLDRDFFKESMRDFIHIASKPKQREMIAHMLMGIPFYGYDGMSAITGPAYIDVLKHYTVEMEYREKDEECAMRYVDEKERLHTVYYPTLKFLAERIALAKKVKCGIAIWELGQGLDYFFDLL